MVKQIVDVMVQGGKATAAPPLGPALGPTGLNIGQVVAEINRKTASFAGMQVPVKVIADTTTKTFEITVGTPPTSALIKKESKVETASGNPKTEKVADLKIEQIIKIAKMKEDALLGKTLKERVKEIIGTCQSMGILVEGVDAKDAHSLVMAGKFDEEIRTEKTELSAQELKELEEERKHLEQELKTRRAEFEVKGKAILEEMKGKTRGAMKTRMVEAGIPGSLIEELLPKEEKKEPGKKA